MLQLLLGLFSGGFLLWFQLGLQVCWIDWAGVSDMLVTDVGFRVRQQGLQWRGDLRLQVLPMIGIVTSMAALLLGRFDVDLEVKDLTAAVFVSVWCGFALFAARVSVAVMPQQSTLEEFIILLVLGFKAFGNTVSLRMLDRIVPWLHELLYYFHILGRSAVRFVHPHLRVGLAGGALAPLRLHVVPLVQLSH